MSASFGKAPLLGPPRGHWPRGSGPRRRGGEDRAAADPWCLASRGPRFIVDGLDLRNQVSESSGDFAGATTMGLCFSVGCNGGWGGQNGRGSIVSSEPRTAFHCRRFGPSKPCVGFLWGFRGRHHHGVVFVCWVQRGLTRPSDPGWERFCLGRHRARGPFPTVPPQLFRYSMLCNSVS